MLKELESAAHIAQLNTCRPGRLAEKNEARKEMGKGRWGKEGGEEKRGEKTAHTLSPAPCTKRKGGPCTTGHHYSKKELRKRSRHQSNRLMDKSKTCEG